MPRLSSTNASSGVCSEKKLRVSSPFAVFSMARPANTIIPATMPPRKRYTGISQPQMCSDGSISGLWRVVVSSSIGALLTSGRRPAGRVPASGNSVCDLRDASSALTVLFGSSRSPKTMQCVGQTETHAGSLPAVVRCRQNVHLST